MYLTQILAEEGDTVLVGQVIAVVEAGEGAAPAPAAEKLQQQQLQQKHQKQQHQLQ